MSGPKSRKHGARPAGAETSRAHVWIEVAGVTALAWAYLHHLQFLTPYMPGIDGYYHIKVAWLTRTQGILQQFPWATQSLWTESFYDKDFGYHLALIPFTFGDLLAGAKLAAVTFGAGLLASFYAVARLRAVPAPWFWTALLAACGGYFAWRLSMPRPHVLAGILALWSVYFVLRGRWVATGLVGIIYALSYTAPLLPAFALIHAGWCFVLQRELPWKTVAAALGGVVLGWVVHPHFPANFVAIWIQIVDVLRSAWSSSGPHLALAGEFAAADTRTFLRENWIVLASALGAVAAIARVRVTLRPPQATLVLLALVFFVAACLSVRFTLYFLPFSLWAVAEVLGAALETERSRTGSAPRWLGRAWPLAAGLAGLALLLGEATSRPYLLHPGPSKRRFAAEWLARHAERDAVVFTCDWDDTPELFFFDHDHRYLVFLDPNYLYRWNPDRWRRWRLVSRGRDKNPVRTIREVFGARYGFCTRAFQDLRRQLEADPRAAIRAESPDGYVFELTG